MSRSKLITITDPTRIGDIRREALSLAHQLGFSETKTGRVGIVATEMSNNVVKHAGKGQVVLRTLVGQGMKALEIVALDKGPGMVDVAKCLMDGYSTAGSPGTGLGAISRLADFFDVYSEPGRGTVVVARLCSAHKAFNGEALEFGAICVPAVEPDPSGDAWSLWEDRDRAQFLLADGLGHGPLAAHAADEAVRLFQEQKSRNLRDILRALHDGLRSTRGASLAIAEINYGRQLVMYAGIGNISGVILDTKSEQLATRSMVSHNGTVGHEIRHVAEFTYPWSKHSLLIMHSDGLTTRWKLHERPGLVSRDPCVIASVLYRDYQRSRDDSSVLVAKQRISGSG